MKDIKYRNKKIWLTAGICICIICGALLIGREEQNQTEQDAAGEQEEILYEEAAGPEPLLQLEEDPALSVVDFEKWLERNPDVYAWISIPDTNVEYPVLQGGSNDAYYLDHTIDGEKGYPGSIYTESINAKDFSDYNTVIYGHNMKNGSMFRHLHKFKEEEFFKDHPFITIYTEEKAILYHVYAAVVYSDKHIMKSYDYSVPQQRLEFIRSLDTGESSNRFREGMTIDENSRLLTLATCIGGRPDNRWIIVAEQVVPR